MNCIKYISKEMEEKIVKEEGLHIRILEGKEIKTFEQFVDIMAEYYKFESVDYNLNALVDWMRDLYWKFDERKFALIIHDYDYFFNNDIELKKLIMDYLIYVTDWWEWEVLECSNAERMDFNVYLVGK